MQSKNLFIFVLITMVILGSVFFGVVFPLSAHLASRGTSLQSEHVLLNHAVQYSSTSNSIAAMQNIASLMELQFELPVHMTIEKIHVDASLETVGLNGKGEVDIPKGPTSPAWFEGSPRPGEIGNAIIVGHFGWKDDIPAVFDDLDKLTKGDKLSVRDVHGVVQTFVVRETRTYGENETASDVFISTDGKAHLNLITCSGVWNKEQKSYPTRLVVFTDKINEQISNN